MSDKKLNAIKEIEFRVNKCKEICNSTTEITDHEWSLNEIDDLLFDINDFINDLKDE